MTPTHDKDLLAIDLFSGCGGLSLGLKKAHFNVIAAIEKDSLAADVYQKNHPEVLLLETDIRNISARALMKTLNLKKGSLDLLAGCPPCQGFSRMSRKNKAKPNKDPRNALVLEISRLANVLRPKFLLMENVPWLQRHWRFKVLLKKLKRLGYKCKYGNLNAAKYGVPQRRRRLILIAAHSKSIKLPSPLPYTVTVRDKIHDLEAVSKSSDPLHTLKTKHSARIAKLISRIPKNGGSRLQLGKKDQLKCHKKTNGFKDVYGRMNWDDVSPTITGSCFNPSKGRFLHPEKNRAITLKEASLLQTFPKSYKFISKLKTSKSDIALLIGNALPPAFAYQQAKHIKQYL